MYSIIIQKVRTYMEEASRDRNRDEFDTPILGFGRFLYDVRREKTHQRCEKEGMGIPSMMHEIIERSRSRPKVY